MAVTKVFAFDAYGTLFDVHAAASAERDKIGVNWERFSQTWRQKHLEYTWIHAQTGRMVSFWTLAQRSLDFASSMVGGIPADVRERLLRSYRVMSAYPEVGEVLDGLKQKGVKLAILSNGDPDMLSEAVEGAGLSGVFDAVISVVEVAVFKPDMAVYGLVSARFECEARIHLAANLWKLWRGWRNCKSLCVLIPQA